MNTEECEVEQTFHRKSYTFFNFNCKSERDMETHISEFKITHSRQNYNEHIQQVDREISEMCNRGFILSTFQTEERQNTYLILNQTIILERALDKQVICFWLNPFVVYCL